MIKFNLIMAILAITFISPLKVSSSPSHLTTPEGPNPPLTIKGENVVLHALFGDIEIPIPKKESEKYHKLLDEQKEEQENKRHKRYVGLFGTRRDNMNYDPWQFADFWECNEQAQIALSAYSDNHRYWEAFFKRNSINDTLAVRYCCNLLEYVDNAEMTLSPECRDQVRLQDHVMIKPSIRYTCRQYEFYNVQCFLVRWMYWWIPLILLILIGVGIFFGCSAIKRRRNKSQLHEDKKSFATEARPYDDNSNTLPYRPAYTTPVTNKAYIHH